MLRTEVHGKVLLAVTFVSKKEFWFSLQTDTLRWHILEYYTELRLKDLCPSSSLATKHNVRKKSLHLSGPLRVVMKC